MDRDDTIPVGTNISGETPGLASLTAAGGRMPREFPSLQWMLGVSIADRRHFTVRACAAPATLPACCQCVIIESIADGRI